MIRDREVIAERTLPEEREPGRRSGEEHFMPMVVDCLRDAETAVGELERVICGAGPGSFTSLRIAASIAKGIAVGADCPLYAVSSLALILAATEHADGKWLAALPAMRDEMFVALFDIESGIIRETGPARILPEASVEDEAARLGADIVGSAGALRQYPHARGAARMLDTILDGGPCDIETWEPLYGRLAEAQVRWEAAHGRSLTPG